METSRRSSLKLISISFILIAILTPQALSKSDDCAAEARNSCYNKSRALKLKLIAVASILITSMIGICLPLISRSLPALSPDRSLFVILKAFAAGIILATGFMHVLPDSFYMLSSSCLKENPWHKFPFTGFVAMSSAIVTLAIDSMATSMYTKKQNADRTPETGKSVLEGDEEMGVVSGGNTKKHNTGMTPKTGKGVLERDEEMSVVSGGNTMKHQHGSMAVAKDGVEGSKLVRYRVIAMVLELGIIVHSVVIGLGLGATNNTCTIKGLVAALCFHQMFEGMGLGGCIQQAEYELLKKVIMAFFFSVTTPFGIALGMALSTVYKENSSHALITVGLLNASSAGILIYMALVNLLAADFLGSKMQGSIKLQLISLAAVLLGAGGMSLMTKWA